MLPTSGEWTITFKKTNQNEKIMNAETWRAQGGHREPVAMRQAERSLPILSETWLLLRDRVRGVERACRLSTSVVSPRTLTT
jgi:hypothetical protein